MLFRVGAVLPKSDLRGMVPIAVDPRPLERFKLRQLRFRAAGRVVDKFQPLPHRAALGKLLFQPELFRHLAQPIVLKAPLIKRLHGFAIKADKIAPHPRGCNVFALQVGYAREQNICKPGAGSHKQVTAQDEFALGGISQQRGGAVDVAVLIDEAVARQVQDHLDVGLQPLTALHAVQRRHLMPPLHRLRPAVGGNGQGVGVLHLGQFGLLMAVTAPHTAGPAAADAHITRHTGQQDRAPGALLSIGMALRAVALHQYSRLRIGIAPGQRPYRAGRNPGDLLRPLRRLDDAVHLAGQIAEHAVPRIRPGGHMHLVKAQTAPIQESLIVKFFAPDHIGHGIQKGGIRGRTNGHPLRPQRIHRVTAAGVNYNHRNALLPRPAQIVHTYAVEPGLRRIVAPEQNQMAVQPVLRAVSRLTGAIHQLGGLRNTGGTV